MRTRNRCYRFWGYNGVGCGSRVEVPKRQFVLIKLSLLSWPFRSKFQKQFMLMFSFSLFLSLFLFFCFSLFSLFLYTTHTQTNVYNIHVYKYILSLAWNCFFLPSTPSGCINIIRVVCTHIFIYCPVYMRGLYWKKCDSIHFQVIMEKPRLKSK